MAKLERIVIATHNHGKRERYGRLLLSEVNEVVDLKDLGINTKPTESGETAEINAEIKARYYSELIQLPVFCEDEALFVDFLPPEEQPGVHVRRINRVDEVDDNKLLEHWEGIIARVPKDKRTGRWHIAYCLAIPGQTVRTVATDKLIRFYSPSSKIRIPGWPMSSLEGAIELNKPHSEYSEEENRAVNEKADRLILKKIHELL